MLQIVQAIEFIDYVLQKGLVFRWSEVDVELVESRTGRCVLFCVPIIFIDPHVED
jgi:hypothetical protein